MLWLVLADCVNDLFMECAAPGVTYAVDGPDGTIRHWPATYQPPAHRYGEADLKAAIVVKQSPGPALMYTIDWDAVIQGAIVFPGAAVVHIGTVWAHAGGVAFTRRSAPAGAVQTPELVRPAALPGPTAWQPRNRWSYGMALLAIGGVDYCNGLKRFGYREAVMIGHLATAGVPAFFHVTEDNPRVVTFSVSTFVDWLLPVTPKAPRSKCIKDLEAEMKNMLYSVLYMALVDPCRPRGGPAEIDVNFFPGCDTVHDALRVRRPLPDIAYTESHPN